MYRFALALALATSALPAFAAGGGCNISGKAYDYDGRPLPNAVVRRIDLQTNQSAYAAVGPDASFAFHDLNAVEYRLDLLSPPTVVTGTMLPTRSIWGMSQAFACNAGQSAVQDVRAQVY